MMTLGYMGKKDRWSVHGWTFRELGSYGIQLDRRKVAQDNRRKNGPKIVDNSKNKVGIK